MLNLLFYMILKKKTDEKAIFAFKWKIEDAWYKQNAKCRLLKICKDYELKVQITC